MWARGKASWRKIRADRAAVAQAYAQNGAKVFISGRRKEVLDKAVQEIKEAGGKVDVIP